jgi:hypothetical protein
MKNLLLIIACAVNISFALAQDNFTMKSIENKDVYFLSLPNSEYKSVGSVKLNDEDLKNVSSLEDRFKIAFEKFNSSEFDGILTREGKTITFIKYSEEQKNRTARTVNSFGKPIYFLSLPSKEYSVLNTTANTIEDKKTVYLLNSIKTWVNSNDKADAIIIENDLIKNIKFK